MKRVYICHPFARDPKVNVRAIRGICWRVVRMGHNPIAPQLSLPQFIEEALERERAIALCLDLVEVCDELWVFWRELRRSAGQEVEIARAMACQKLVVHVPQDAWWKIGEGEHG